MWGVGSNPANWDGTDRTHIADDDDDDDDHDDDHGGGDDDYDYEILWLQWVGFRAPKNVSQRQEFLHQPHIERQPTNVIWPMENG